MKPMLRSLVLTIGALCLSALAQTQARNTSGVHGPVVDEGHRSVQYRIAWEPDTERNAQRLHYQQSINGALRWRLITQFRSTDGSLVDFDWVRGELLWQVTPDERKWQQGLRLDARYRDDNRPGLVSLNWTNQFPITDKWRGRAIGIVSFEYGDNARSGPLLETRFSAVRSLPDGWKAGAEVFNSYGAANDFPRLGDQRHQIGPYVSKSLGDGLSVSARALIGATSSSPDVDLGLWIGKKF